jgi:hypothetical protein
VIYEFAVDPAVVATWHERERYRFFKGKFGLGCPRVLSMFPDTEWARRVLNDFDRVFEGSPSDRQDARKRLDALLVQLGAEASRRRGNVASEQPWLPEAEVEHGQRPFHRLLSMSNPRNNADVLLAADVDEETPGWHMECAPVRRTADAIAAALAPMLRFAREVKLVDPYFDASKEDRWVRTLVRVLEVTREHRGAGEGVSVELHTSVERARDRNPLTDVEAERVAANIVHDCKTRLPRRLPTGTAVTIVVWSEKDGGEQFHNRYVLTNVGGVLLGTGLDSAQGRAARDDFVVLARQQYVERWRQLHPNSNTFTRRGRPERISAPSQHAGGQRRSGTR